MATQGGIADGLLFRLAEDIETGEQMEALGRTLGLKAAAINRYTVTNNRGDRVTCKGTRDMLFDWRQTVEHCDQHLRLKQALTDAKLVMLAKTYLKGTPIIRDVYDEKISESLTVQQCREKLENKYLNQLCKIQLKPWDQGDYADLKDMHTVVTVVKKDARGHDTNKKEVLQGSVSDIFSTKVNGRLPARILISAPAGRGKTTSVAKMAYDWVRRERGSALEHLPLLFVVKFRNTDHLTSIGEAIKSQLLSDVDDLTPEGLESFIRKNQGICHIILDGLDEYAGISSSYRSLGSNIVSVIRWEMFLQCRVLVTARPHLENFFNQASLPRVYTKMWIEGFSRESSRDYIDKFFASSSDPNSGHGLKVYLDIQPLIDELVKTPLFCLMVCHLWSMGLLDSGITTQTELLDSVNAFLMHYTNARSSKVLITPEMLRKIILQLGEVALTGLLDDAKKLIFRLHDFRRVPAILDMACELGIVSKTTVSLTRLPQSSETTSTTIEFYHKIAQEHSAGKFLADETYHVLLPFKISKLDRVLRKIKANIGDYENLIRFAAGTDNKLCIRIMEMLLTNRFLDESERYRILLDCSSETTGTEGNVSSLVRRCLNAEKIVLKSSTVYTVVGMQNLPKQLKREVRIVKLEGSVLTTDVTSKLWSCLESFSMLRNLIILDSSLSFPLSPPELPSVTKLSAERVTSQGYKGLLLSLPGLIDIDIIIDDAERDIPQITAGLRWTGGQQLTTIRLEAPSSLPSEKTSVSTETMRGLGHLIIEHTKNLQWLWLSRVNCRKEEDLVELVESWRHVNTLNHLMFFGCGTRKGGRLERHVIELLISRKSLMVIVLHDNGQLVVNNCHFSSEITVRIWSCLRSFTSLNQLTISDSSLSFPPSPSILPSVTKLYAERVTSQSYMGLFSSLPGLRDIDITISDAERDIPQITAGLRRTGGRQLTTIRLEGPSSIPSEKKNVSTETMRELGHLIIKQTKNLQWLWLSRVNCRKEEDLVELVESCRHVKTLNYITFLGCGTKTGGRLGLHVSELLFSQKSLMVIVYHDNGQLVVNNCHLSSEITVRIWSCLRSFTSLNHLTISDSSLSFPPSPPELPSVTKLSAERVTSQSYEGLLSSLPGVKDIDIIIDDPERDIAQITAGLRRTGGQQLTYIKLRAPSSLPSKKKYVSRETMRRLGLLIREQSKNLQRLNLSWVMCTDEDDLVYLIECCRHVKTLQKMWLDNCGTREGGRLESHLKGIHSSSGNLSVYVYHDGFVQCYISPHDEKEQSHQSPHFTRLGNEVFASQTENVMTDKYHSEGSFDQTGGELHIPSYGLNLSIPPGALPEGSGKAITLDVLTDIPPEITLRNNETLVTYGFQCLPSGLQFPSEKPVRLKIPHCANLIDPTKVQVVLYSMNHEGGGERIVQTSETCKVTYNHVVIFLQHFSGGFLAFIRDAFSIKYKRMSFMPFLPKNMSQSKELTLQFRMVNKPRGNSWRDVHDIRKEAVYQPAKDDDDEMNVKDDDMEVTCQLNDYDTLKKVVDASFIRKTKHTVYFDLDFIGKANELLVKLNVIQSMLPMEIHFRTHFLPHCVDIPTPDAPTEANEVWTPTFRPTEKSREQDFDDLLKTVAKQIRKHVDIDNLGIALGFQPAEIICYIQTNEKYQTVTYMGTLSMLRDWRNRTTRSEEREQLRKVLIVLKHHRLVDDHLNDDIKRMTETSPRNTVSTSQRPSASTSVGIPPQGASAAADEFSASK